MLQTLDDMLTEHRSKSERVEVWLRIGRELPFNIIEEHISNLQGMNMGRLPKDSNKRVSILAGAVVILALGIGLGLFLQDAPVPYSPTTFAELQKATTKRQACIQTLGTNGTKDHPQNKDYTYIENSITSSIVDAAAGTNVDAYFKTYDGKTATGTTAYSGKYGTYNFTAEKSTGDTGDPNYFGHWKVTRFEPCRA